MEQEEHDAAKEIINQKLQLLAVEIGKLTSEIMSLEQSPFCRTTLEITNVMGMGSIDIHVQIPPKEILEEINKVTNILKESGMEQSETKVPSEQVDELLKQMRGKGNWN
jgi:hypothetical protein